MSFLDDAGNAIKNAGGFIADGAGALAKGAIGLGQVALVGAGAVLLDEAGRSLGEAFDDLLDPAEKFLGLKPGETIQPASVASNTVNVGGLDPIQGYDVGVWVEDIGRGHQTMLVGQFTSILITVKNASEAYLPVGSKIPVYFDGEIQIAWTMEKGLLDMLVFQETFGFKALDFNNRYYRTPRFKITFAVDPVDWWALDESTRTPDGSLQRTSAGRFVLDLCKVDTWTLGARAGKDVVATQWTGLAQQIRAIPYTAASMNTSPAFGEVSPRAGDHSDYFNPDGTPKVPQRVYAFTYRNEAETSTTVIKPTQRSYASYPSFYNLNTVLEAERAFIMGIPGWNTIPGLKDVLQAALDQIDKVQQNGSMVGPDGFPGKRSSNDGNSQGLITQVLATQRQAMLDQVSNAAALGLTAQQVAALTLAINNLGKLTGSDPVSFSDGVVGSKRELLIAERQRLVELFQLNVDNASNIRGNSVRNLLRSQLAAIDKALEEIEFGGGRRSSNDESVGGDSPEQARLELLQELAQIPVGGTNSAGQTRQDKQDQIDFVDTLIAQRNTTGTKSFQTPGTAPSALDQPNKWPSKGGIEVKTHQRLVSQRQILTEKLGDASKREPGESIEKVKEQIAKIDKQLRKVYLSNEPSTNDGRWPRNDKSIDNSTNDGTAPTMDKNVFTSEHPRSLSDANTSEYVQLVAERQALTAKKAAQTNTATDDARSLVVDGALRAIELSGHASKNDGTAPVLNKPNMWRSRVATQAEIDAYNLANNITPKPTPAPDPKSTNDEPGPP